MMENSRRRHLVIGNSDCGYVLLANTIQNAQPPNAFVQNWRQVCRELEIGDKVFFFENKLRLDNTFTDNSLIHDILVEWRSRKAGEATIENLIAALENCNLESVIEEIGETFDIFIRRQQHTTRRWSSSRTGPSVEVNTRVSRISAKEICTWVIIILVVIVLIYFLCPYLFKMVVFLKKFLVAKGGTAGAVGGAALAASRNEGLRQNIYNNCIFIGCSG